MRLGRNSMVKNKEGIIHTLPLLGWLKTSIVFIFVIVFGTGGNDLSAE